MTLNEKWSDELKAATREAISAGGALSSDGRLHLKHSSSAFGYIELDNLVRNELRVVDKQTGAASLFADTDALICAGWAVD